MPGRILGESVPFDQPAADFNGNPFFTDGSGPCCGFQATPYSLLDTIRLNWDEASEPMKQVSFRSTISVASLLLLHACASAPPVTPDNAGDYLARAQTQAKDGISVTAGVPDRKESRAIFKTDLYKRGVQPVWLEITNSSDERVTVLPAGLDPGYFSPTEAANLDLKLLPEGKSSPKMDVRFCRSEPEYRYRAG